MVQNNLEVTSLITPFINAYRALGNEWNELFDIGLREYLHNQTNKYYFTNTFLHRSEKVRFFDVYFPIKIKYGQLTTKFENPWDVLEEYKYITIIGTAGSGKSTLVKSVFLNSLRNPCKIPVLIELRHLNEYNGDVEKLINDKILRLAAKPSEGILNRTLLDGKFLFLLDGYDEIFTTKKQELNRQVELFVDTYPKNHFIITTRPGSGIEQFPRFHDFRVCDLSKEDTENFINLLVTEKERRNRILKVIKDPTNKSYSQYLQNPLLLSMFILAFESHPEIPNKKSAFYKNVFDTLYSKHDGITKNSFLRERKTKLQREDFETILNLFSYISTRDGTYAYTEEYLSNMLSLVKKNIGLHFKNDDFIYDLQTSISIFIKDGFEYKFPHRSMQEYFTAQFISRLPSEKKEKAYTNLKTKWKEKSRDTGYNLWELCNELDFVHFSSIFVLPEIRKCNELIKMESEEAMLLSFLKLIEARILCTRTRILSAMQSYRSNSISYEFYIRQQRNVYTNLIEFTQTYSFAPLNDFINKNGLNQYIYENLSTSDKWAVRSSNRYDLIELTSSHKIIANMLLKSNICILIKRFRLQTLRTIRELETKIDNQNSYLNNILDI